MKKTFYSLIVAAVVSFGSLCAQGAEVTSQAIILKVNGTVTSGESQALKVGDKLSQGATITTGAGSSVDVQAFNGAVATIGENSTVGLEKLSVTTSGGAVTKQTALLNLKVGRVLSKIDPANHNINDYGIRTPKGVAAARGTIFNIIIDRVTGSVRISVIDSQVLFTPITPGVLPVLIKTNFTLTIPAVGPFSAPVETDTPSTGTPTGTPNQSTPSSVPSVDPTQANPPSEPQI